MVMEFQFTKTLTFPFNQDPRLIAICIDEYSYHACIIIFSFVVTKHLDIASYIGYTIKHQLLFNSLNCLSYW